MLGCVALVPNVGLLVTPRNVCANLALLEMPFLGVELWMYLLRLALLHLVELTLYVENKTVQAHVSAYKTTLATRTKVAGPSVL